MWMSAVGWACVYSSAGCCWLLILLGECNVVPTTIGANTQVGIKVSCVVFLFFLNLHTHLPLQLNAAVSSVTKKYTFLLVVAARVAWLADVS